MIVARLLFSRRQAEVFTDRGSPCLQADPNVANQNHVHTRAHTCARPPTHTDPHAHTQASDSELRHTEISKQVFGLWVGSVVWRSLNGSILAEGTRPNCAASPVRVAGLTPGLAAGGSSRIVGPGQDDVSHCLRYRALLSAHLTLLSPGEFHEGTVLQMEKQVPRFTRVLTVPGEHVGGRLRTGPE